MRTTQNSSSQPVRHWRRQINLPRRKVTEQQSSCRRVSNEQASGSRIRRRPLACKRRAQQSPLRDGTCLVLTSPRSRRSTWMSMSCPFRSWRGRTDYTWARDLHAPCPPFFEQGNMSWRRCSGLKTPSSEIMETPSHFGFSPFAPSPNLPFFIFIFFFIIPPPYYIIILLVRNFAYFNGAILNFFFWKFKIL